MSELTFSLTGSSASPAKFVAKVRDFELVIDEPPSLGGTDQAPNPVEYLLASYAGCLNVVSYLIAREQGITLEGLKINISGELNPNKLFGKSSEDRAGFKGIRVKLIPETSATIEQLSLWLREVELRCPVNDNLSTATPIFVSVEKNFQEFNGNFSLN